MEEKVKLKDIAERLGVSIVAVSKALNDKDGISDKLKEKVRQVALEMGYETAVMRNRLNRSAASILVIVARNALSDINMTQSFYLGFFEKLSEEAAPQGVLAVLAQPDCTPAPPRGNALFLDGIADPGNLGTIVRTANGAGYADVYLRNCADPFAPKCVRAAMSGIFFVRLHIGGDGELFGALGGVPFVCADMAGEDMFSFSPPRPFCLVIGSEANGVSEEVRARCAQTVSVPLRETCESLNAAVAAGILMYQLSK